MNRRQYPRKALDPIHIAEMRTVDSATVLATAGTILNASATGLLIRVSRSALHPSMEQSNRALEALAGEYVVMHIVEMALDIDGKVVRTHRAVPEWCDIAIDYSENAPTYWRECLADLLPNVGEMQLS